MNRKKLTKLIDKELLYTATYDKIGNCGLNICVTDVKQGNKTLTDHAWIQLSKGLSPSIKKGDKISFLATARTYKDTRGQRKNGLYKCRKFTLVNDEYETHVKKEEEDYRRRGC